MNYEHSYLIVNIVMFLLLLLIWMLEENKPHFQNIIQTSMICRAQEAYSIWIMFYDNQDNLEVNLIGWFLILDKNSLNFVVTKTNEYLKGSCLTVFFQWRQLCFLSNKIMILHLRFKGNAPLTSSQKTLL